MSELTDVRHRRRWPWYGAGVLATLLVMLLSLPYGIRWGAEYWLRKQGQEARIQAVAFNPFTGRLELSTVEAGRAAADHLDLQSVVVRVDWWPLWKKRVYVEDLSLTGVVLDVRREADGTVTIGGLPVAAGSQPAPQPEERAGQAWGIGLGKVDLQDVRVRYQDPSLHVEFLLQRLHVDPLASWEPESPTPFELVARVEGGTIQVTGTAKPFAPAPSVDARLVLSKLPVGWLEPVLATTGVTKFGVQVDAAATVSARASPGTREAEVTYRGSLSLTGLQAATSAVRVQLDRLTWDGEGSGHSTAGQTTMRVAGAVSMEAGRVSSADAEASVSSATVKADLAGAVGTHIAVDGDLDLSIHGAQAPGVMVPALNLRWRGPVEADPRERTASSRGELLLQETTVSLMDAGLQASLGELRWAGQAGLASAGERAPIPRAAGATELRTLRVRSIAQDREILAVDSAQVSGLSVDGPSEVSAGEVRIGGIRALQEPPRDGGEPSDVVEVESVEVDSARWAGGARAEVEAVRLTGVVANLARNESGNLVGTELLPVAPGKPESETQGPPAAGQPESGAGPVSFRLGRLDLKDEARVTWRDRSVAPPVQLDLAISKLQVDQVDTTDPAAVTSLELVANLGKYSEIRADARGTLLAPLASGSATVKVQNVTLPALTGYTQRYLGYRLKTGQLDLDTKAAIDGGQLDAQNQLALHRLELDLLHPAEQDKLTQELGLPLNTALSLLRDRDGDIRLSIPVQGDLKSPDVSVGDAVRKAMMKGVTAGIKTAAVVFFAPVGAVLAAGKLVGLATALRFEPVLFDPGQTRLNEEARAYLDRLSERLRDRPGVRITLCGVTTDADVSALQQAALAAAARPTTAVPGAGTANTAPVTTLPSEGAAPKTEPNEQSPPKEAGSAPLPEPPPVSRDELLDVGQRRGEVVRDYLVERGRIDSDRLLPCSPQHEEAKEAKSRVDIAL